MPASADYSVYALCARVYRLRQICVIVARVRNNKRDQRQEAELSFPDLSAGYGRRLAAGDSPWGLKLVRMQLVRACVCGVGALEVR